MNRIKRGWSIFTRQLKPYTVILYLDTMSSMETFVERVWGASPIDAWDIAVKQAKDSGTSSSGCTIDPSEFDDACEVVTFDGHAANATY